MFSLAGLNECNLIMLREFHCTHLTTAQSSLLQKKKTTSLTINLQRWQGQEFPPAMHRIPTLHFSFDFAIERCRQWVPPCKVCLLSGFGDIGPIPSQHDFHDDGAAFWCSLLATHPTPHWSTGCCIHATLLLSNHHVMTMNIQGWIEDQSPRIFG